MQRFLLIFGTALLAPVVMAYCAGMGLLTFEAAYVGNSDRANALMTFFMVVALGCWPIARLLQRRLPSLALAVATLGLGSNLFVCYILAFHSLRNMSQSLTNFQSVDLALFLTVLMMGLAFISAPLCGWMIGQIIRRGYLFKVPPVESAGSTER